ncbi:MAG: MBOAT family protein [Bacteroidales bacterium]|nr:MBOAT family protein [Bacteroidales bacterium]
MEDLLKKIFLFNENAPLIFTRFYFWAFFTIVLTIYVTIYKKKAIRNIFLFAVSLFFYYKTSGFYFVLLIFSTITDYFIGGLVYKSDKKASKKLLVALSVTINLLVLGYFKYSYLFIDTINFIFNSNFEVINQFAVWSNSFTGSHFDIDKIILPVGISFFTFQTISYTVDIYRGRVKPVNNILDFGFYVSFFPQLVAGPIVRASEFVPQLYKDFNLTKQEFGLAIFMIINGLLKKMWISDYIAVNFIDRIFSNPQMYGGIENLLALYGYSIQVYLDFSGYTDIAIGVALLLGFRLPQNFNSPYKAQNTGEFWKRWHISLSSWLKDYLYIPLGGSKKGKFRTNVNLMITMLLGGLWHGASWKFVIWGGLNGIGLVVYKLWLKISPFKNDNRWWVKFYAIFITFNFITFTRIWFRADNTQKANELMYQIVHAFDISQIGAIIKAYYPILLLIIFAYIVHWLPTKTKNWYKNLFIDAPIWAKAIAIIVAVFLIYQTRTAEVQPFIYFQF